jgi:iron complex outermembrane receptor protein
MFAQTPEKDLKDLIGLLNQTVGAASKQLEPLRESPVPVTLITAEMIQLSGARTLQDLLTLFVPGMTSTQDHNEYVVAMRGVYTSSQQKILILLDGHRLNSRAYSMAAPDWSMSLDKIRQIEILRGPASSLYGNVALTAVVNLVTKSAAEAAGTSATLGGGSYGQRYASVLHGHDFGGENELLLWGQYYQAQGETRAIPAAEDYSRMPRNGTAILDGFRDPPSFDTGLRYSGPTFTLLANRRSAKYIEPFSAGGKTGEVYDYSQYRSFLGLGPGLESTSNHLGLELRGAPRLDLAFVLRFNYDTNDLRAAFVTDPATRSFGMPAWSEQDYGFTADLTWDYGAPGMESTVLLGAQMDRLRLVDSAFPEGTGGEWVRLSDASGTPLLEPGQETTASLYAQVKHRFSPGLIFNGGFRFDHKQRHEGSQKEDLSPRLAVVWIPGPTFEVKLSFARSFVDAPYWYRYNSLPSYRGATDLRPEHMESFQITPSWTTFGGRWKNTLNLFSNRLWDVVFRNNLAAPSEPVYSNSGSLRSWGLEWESAVVKPLWRARGNATYQRAAEAKDYGVRDGRIFNIPSLTFNASFDVSLGSPFGKPAWLDLSWQHLGSRLSPIDISFPEQGGPSPSPARHWSFPDNTLPSVDLLNFGARVPGLLGPRSFLDLRVTNLANTQWKQGGSVNHPYPQAGRWVTVKLGFSLDRILEH